ncbi:MAG: hypothetical protein R2824_31165 [Saprospiraceae bacterium]
MILHILNGDSTDQIMQQLDIPGKRAVWREVMCEGPVSGDMQEAAFWESRADFIAGLADTDREEYFRKTGSELDKIRQAAEFEEVVLWFEYDLFCQINLLTALHFLQHLPDPARKISLICVGDWPGKQYRQTLGEIEPEVYYELFASRQLLSAEALSFADWAWQLYRSPNAELLNDAANFQHPDFPYLAEAINLHRQRFPSASNGLNVIEFHTLQQIQSGIQTERALVGANLRTFRDAGFGDLQHVAYLRHLSPLFTIEEERMYLNEYGSNVLRGAAHFFTPVSHIGGAPSTAYAWDGEEILAVQL